MRKPVVKTQGDKKTFNLEKRQAVRTAKDLCYSVAVVEAVKMRLVWKKFREFSTEQD